MFRWKASLPAADHSAHQEGLGPWLWDPSIPFVLPTTYFQESEGPIKVWRGYKLNGKLTMKFIFMTNKMTKERGGSRKEKRGHKKREQEEKTN